MKITFETVILECRDMEQLVNFYSEFLDCGVPRGDLQQATGKALQLGAKIAETQYGGDEWITLLDPAGHPFCLLIWD